MIDHQPAIDHMQALLDQWEAADDRRCIFLGCYSQMTANMLKAIQAGEFHDNQWVGRLLEHFADYYFKALETYEQQPTVAPAVWQVAFQLTGDPEAHVLQHLMLGINAHINFDLVFALEDMLRDEWADLSPSQRMERYQDHCRVNQVIASTVDAVQDSVVERFAPRMDLIDDGLGHLDEWLASRLISIYRDRVWQKAVERLQAQDEYEREAIGLAVENSSLQRAQLIHSWSLGKALKGLIDDFVEEP